MQQYFIDLLLKFQMYIPFLMIIGIIAIILIRAHISSNQQFTIFDLIVDKDTGKGSLEKVGMLTAMLTVTWWFIDLTARGKSTWEDMVMYAGVLGLAKVANSFISAKYTSKG